VGRAAVTRIAAWNEGIVGAAMCQPAWASFVGRISLGKLSVLLCFCRDSFRGPLSKRFCLGPCPSQPKPRPIRSLLLVRLLTVYVPGYLPVRTYHQVPST